MGLLSGFWKQSRDMVDVAAISARHKAKFFALPRLVGYTDEWKNRHQNDFDARVLAIMQAPDRRLALRAEIADWALRYADYQVLSMTDEIKRESFYADCTEISTELPNHLPALLEFHDALREFWWRLKDSPLREGASLEEAVFHFATTNSLLAVFFANGFNLLRGVCEAPHPVGRDWYRPLILSSMIWAEDDYRSKIGLPSLLSDTSTAFYHLSFAELVRRGERNPLFVWQDTTRLRHPYYPTA